MGGKRGAKEMQATDKTNLTSDAGAAKVDLVHL